MAKFPDWQVGTDVSAQNLAYMVPNIVIKQSTTTRSGTTTLADDPELSGLALSVGQWWVKFHLYVSCSTSATPDIKTQWAFTGTAAATVRMLKGPGSTNTSAQDQLPSVRMGAAASNANAVYGLNASTGFSYVEEESFSLIVTVAGNLSLQWAQNTSDASNTNVHAQSVVQYRQVA